MDPNLKGYKIKGKVVLPDGQVTKIKLTIKGIEKPRPPSIRTEFVKPWLNKRSETMGYTHCFHVHQFPKRI